MLQSEQAWARQPPIGLWASLRRSKREKRRLFLVQPGTGMLERVENADSARGLIRSAKTLSFC